MDYKYLYISLKIELMKNLDLTPKQWEETKNFIRKQETEQLNLGGVVGRSDQLLKLANEPIQDIKINTNLDVDKMTELIIKFK